MKITKEQILGIVRQVMTMVGAILTSYGILEVKGTSVESIIGFVLMAVPTIWGFIDKSNSDGKALFSLIRHGVSIISGILVVVLPQHSKIIGIIIPAITQMVAILLSYNANDLATTSNK